MSVETLFIPRGPVIWFSKVMERKLRRNDHKGGWDTNHLSELYARLQEESEELRDALSEYDLDGIIDECSDVANFAMMLADRAKNLKERGF